MWAEEGQATKADGRVSEEQPHKLGESEGKQPDCTRA